MKPLNISHFKPNLKEQKTFRILVLEDSDFFNKMLTRQLEHYTTILGMEKNCKFEIVSYTSATDCLRNLKNDTDIAFVDYYLGDGINGADVVQEIKERCWDCKIIVMSQVKNLKTTSISLAEGAIDFIFKDSNALPKSCFILEDIVNSSLSHHELN